jgi:hypothetical protein
MLAASKVIGGRGGRWAVMAAVKKPKLELGERF